MTRRELHDGRADGLTPLEPIDLAKIGGFAELVEAMGRTAFGGRQLGAALEILQTAASDPDCTVVMTISGAMTIAKQGKIVCDLLERGVVQVIVATGALIAHGLTESIGCVHYQYDPGMDDHSLYERGYNRVYDTLEMEANLNDVERLVRNVLESDRPDDGVWSSARLCQALGRRLDAEAAGPAILRSAYRRRVPVFIPAFTDSELGLDVAAWQLLGAWRNSGVDPQSVDGKRLLETAPPPFNPFLDLWHYAQTIAASKRLAIFTIGGGVPRNWAQQIGPFFDVVNARVGTQWPPPRFQYGVRICPEPEHWGGLSGCTYSEGVSWGKFVSPAEGGRFAEVHADATLVLPLLAKALLERLDSKDTGDASPDQK
ncbi:MAG TPA: deoxyhypusine synthase [Planctomycetaceae bacterium]|nr:deoxyhypusine synthase [Planctomycetaceae bacterium]